MNSGGAGLAAARLEGQDYLMSIEPVAPDGRLILDPDRPIIDSQFHLFDRPALRYLFDDYVADVNAGHNVVASVYVETSAFSRNWGPEVLRPLGEVEFANGIGAMSESGTYGKCRIAAAIVCHADLRQGNAVAELLDRALGLSPGRVRGVRQITLYHESEAPYRYMSARPPRVHMDDKAFRRGFGQLASRRLTFDAAIFHTQLGDLFDLAAAFPETTVILNHLGYAMALDTDEQGRAAIFTAWRKGLRAIATLPNVYCKIGGLGMPPWGFGFELRASPASHLELAAAWRPYVEEAIAAFGVGRCMMESNFPPDRRSCNYVTLWNALKYIVSVCSESEKTALFHDTAAGVYRIESLPAG
jgi:predicted TIM-barrel fold metal-dependent hydrolase